jgi:hypothetical protein
MDVGSVSCGRINVTWKIWVCLLMKWLVSHVNITEGKGKILLWRAESKCGFKSLIISLLRKRRNNMKVYGRMHLAWYVIVYVMKSGPVVT